MSFDNRFSGLSPGTLVIDHAAWKACGLSASEFDFLGDTGERVRALALVPLQGESLSAAP